MNPIDDEQVLAYLSGESDGLAPDPGLDDLRALLADPATWDQPRPSLADDVVAAVAVAASTAPRPVPAPAAAQPQPVLATVVPASRRRRLVPAGLTAAAVAASVALGTIVGANLDDGTTSSSTPTAALAGQAQPVMVPPAGLPSVVVTAREKEGLSQAEQREIYESAGTVETGPSLGRFPGLLYWLGPGPDGSARLSREVTEIFDKNGRANGALRALLNRRPADPDSRSPWPAGSSGDVDLSSVAGGMGAQWPAGTAVVYLNSAALAARASAGEARAAVQQIVWTLRANDPTIAAVVISAIEARDRKALAARGLWSSGESFDRPVRPEDASVVLAPVQIDGPTEGATLEPENFAVSGAAITATGRIRWEVLDRGQVLRRGEAATDACCGLSPYSFALTLPPGRYTIVVYPGPDGSAGPTSRVVEVRGTTT